ncbi:MAG: hypothetical protein U5K75_08965 [Ahrensia sp.]|nr:hypothetical protein [Ahrensia sp.]
MKKTKQATARQRLTALSAKPARAGAEAYSDGTIDATDQFLMNNDIVHLLDDVPCRDLIA